MNEIEKLLDKYFAGGTSWQEENKLKYYFQQDNVPDNLIIYKELFNYYDATKKLGIKNEQFDKQVIDTIRKQKQSSNNLLYKVIGIAATFLIIFVSYLYFKPTASIDRKDKIVLTSDEQFAIKKTIDVFVKVSNIIHRVSEPLNNMKYIEKTDRELEKLNYYNKYNKFVLKYLGPKS